jgi:hypothetical protein
MTRPLTSEEKKKLNDKLKLYDKAYDLRPEIKKKYLDSDYVIDANKRKVTDKVNDSEPRMTE